MEKLKEFKKWIPFLVGAFVILAVFLFIRLYELTNVPVFVDEAIYIRWAQVMRAESTLRFLPLSDGKQPLFMWIMIPVLKFVTDPLIAGRLVSVFSGLGTIVGIGATSWYLFKSKKVVLFTSFLWAISPYSVFFDKMALVDSLLVFFGIWTFFFAMLTVQKERLDLAMITGFFLGGALLTKSPALFFVILLPVVILLAKWPKGLKAMFYKKMKLLGLFIPTVVIGYSLYSILRLGPNFHMIAIRNLDYVFPISHLWLNPKDPFIFLVPKAFDWIGKMGPWPIMVLAIMGILVSIKKYLPKIAVLCLWFIFPLLVQAMFAKVFTARYIYYCLPYLFILAGASLLTKNTIIKYLTYGFGILVVIISFRFNGYLLGDVYKANLPRSERSGYLEEWSAGQGIKETADYIEALYLADPQKIVVGTEGYFGTLPDALQAYLNKYPEIIVIGVGLNFDELPLPLVESQKAGNLTYFVVNSTRLHTDPDKIYVSLVKSFPKAERPNGTKEELLLFEVKDETAFPKYIKN